MMKSLVLGVIAGLVVVGVASYWGSTEVRADNGPHTQNQPMTTDACAGCHRAHTAQAGYLLKTAETQLCLTCHDGSGATTNVKNGVSTLGGGLRAGGFETAAIDTEDPTWRFSVECTESNPLGSPVPGYPGVTCTDNDATAGETVRVTMCGSGTVVPAVPTNSTQSTGVGTYACTVSNTVGNPSGYYGDPGGWFLKIGVLGIPEPTNSNHGVEGVLVGPVAGIGTTVWGAGPHNPIATPGLATTAALECSSCHNPHGNGQYRILRPNPATMVGLAGTFPGGVSIPDQCPDYDNNGTPNNDNTSCKTNVYLYTTANYFDSTFEWYTNSSVDGGAPGATTTLDGMSAFCSQCHSRYLARSVWNIDSGDAIFRFRHSTEGSPSYNGRQCNTCHAVHGSNSITADGGNSAGVLYPDTTSRPNDNNSLLKMDNRGQCVKCHKRP